MWCLSVWQVTLNNVEVCSENIITLKKNLEVGTCPPPASTCYFLQKRASQMSCRLDVFLSQ